MKGINPIKETYHHSVIREFSETSRFMMSGVSRGFVKNRYAWFADFMNKFQHNTSFNPHIAYLSFFSDREIAISELANVKKLTDIYPCILNIKDSILSQNSHELSTKQYANIAQKYSGFDVVELINESNTIKYDGNTTKTISKNYSYYYAPVIFETGYKVNKGALSINNPFYQPDHDLFIWSTKVQNGRFGRYLSTLTIRDYGFDLTTPSDYDGDHITEERIVSDIGLNAINRIVSYKVLPIDSLWSFFDKNNECVHYPFQLSEGMERSYRNFIGIPIICENKENNLIVINRPGDTILFPQIMQNNVIERQKIISNSPYPLTGRMAFHSNGLSLEESDQSVLVYTISAYCVYNAGEDGYQVGQAMISDPSVIIPGIDINTERNRRNSALVTTDPYMKVVPLNRGEIVEFKFVKYDGSHLNPHSFEPKMILKLKASRSFIRALDVELAKNEVNDDIIHTIYIKNPSTSITVTGSNNQYAKLGGNLTYYLRQEYALDDRVGGITGVGNYFSFQINAPENLGYSNGKAKICGMGHYVKTLFNGTCEEYAVLYCTNYVPDDAIIINVSSTNMTYHRKEIFRPMLKVPGIGGYVKIISRSRNIDAKILHDGDEEVAYDVEFPFSPGSYLSRLHFSSSYIKTQVFIKSIYLKAGSRAIDLNGRYDEYNERHVLIGDDAFSRIDMFMGYHSDIETYPESDGGGCVNPAVNPKMSITYPRNLIYYLINPSFLWLTKPAAFNDDGLGTFQFTFDNVQNSGTYLKFPADIKMVIHADNRMWRFDNNKFSSYINRECPSYVFEIDATELSNEFGRNQHFYGGIPELKRWLFANVIASCKTALSLKIESDQSNTDETIDVDSANSLSDMIIEIWDNAYTLGNLSTRAMWRPITPTLFDTLKYRSRPLLEGLHCEGFKTPVYEPAGLYKVLLGKFNSNTFDAGLSQSELNAVINKSNLALYDSKLGKTFHIAYITEEISDPNNSKIIVYLIMDASDELSQDESLLNPAKWVGPIGIFTPYSKISKNTDFSFNSSKIYNSNLITRYIDFGDKKSATSDFKRYVHNGKIYIRVRPLKGRMHPVSYTQDGVDVMQWVGPYVTGLVNDDTNFPWYDPFSQAQYYNGFDWSRIDLIEHVRRIKFNYFTLQSK